MPTPCWVCTMLYTVGHTEVYVIRCLSSRRLWNLSFRDRIFLMKQKIIQVSKYMLVGSREKFNVEQTN